MHYIYHIPQRANEAIALADRLRAEGQEVRCCDFRGFRGQHALEDVTMLGPVYRKAPKVVAQPDYRVTKNGPWWTLYRGDEKLGSKRTEEEAWDLIGAAHADD
jgi:hypothetical protein